MYKEVLKHPEASALKNVLYIVGLVFFIMVFAGLADIIYRTYDMPFVNYLVFAVLVAVVFYVINQRIVEYRYSLIDNELIFEKMIGKRERPLLNIQARSIKAFDQLNHYKERTFTGEITKVYRFTLKIHSPKVYYVIYEKDGRFYQVHFQPSERLIEKLKKCLSKPDSQPC